MLTILGDFALIPFLGLVGAGISVAFVQPLVATGTLLLARRIVVRAVPLRGPTLAAAGLALACGVALDRAGWAGSAVAAVTMLFWGACSLDPSVQRLVLTVYHRIRIPAVRQARS